MSKLEEKLIELGYKSYYDNFTKQTTYYKNNEYYDHDQAITDVEILLNQYNIITAPKTIKLSEIVERLKNELKDYVVRYVGSAITICQDGWCYAVVYIDEDTHNFEFEMQDRFNFPKWLYTLWIAGTEIINDLKEE